MSNIIQTDKLTFKYRRDKKVLNEVSLNVPEGSIYGFLGPNGAGKSTTMRLLTGILPEQGNAIRLFEKPLQSQLPKVFAEIGSLVEQPALYLHLNGIDNLRYIAKLRHIPESKIAPALKLVDLDKDGKRKVKQYSLGMKQRLAIAMALLSEPKLLLLDEPVNGLDPSGIQEIRQLLIRLNRENGVSIFVSSHLLSEIEKMCTHIGIIHQGQLRFEGRMNELAANFETANMLITLQDAELWVDRLKAVHPEVKIVGPQQIALSLPNREAIPELSRELIQNGANLYEIRTSGGLEEWFISLTNNTSTN